MIFMYIHQQKEEKSYRSVKVTVTAGRLLPEQQYGKNLPPSSSVAFPFQKINSWLTVTRFT